MPEKNTAVFLCHCGLNIADSMDLDAIATWAAGLNGVTAVFRHNLLCSPDGQAYFQHSLTDRQPDRIVVAACSPKMHEKTFQQLAEAGGSNLAHLQIANIREHCGWVTPDKDEATGKAKALIHAAICRAERSEPLTRQTMKVNTDVVVIGGGIAGIEAAMTAARAGRQVTIVEKEISLGGQIIKTEEVAPAMECAPCVLAARLTALKETPNIRVLSNAEVTEVLGFYGNFTVRIHRRARAVKDNCIGCEMCFEVCPVSVTSRFHLGLGTHKAIYTLFPGSVPAAAAIDKEACRHFTDSSCDECVKVCPFASIDFAQPDEQIEVQAGAIIVATGYADGDVSRWPELGWGTLDNVYTLPEFERIASSNGPYGGQIQLRDGRPPASVAVVHCAGSLREDGIPYCSRVCCTGALKVGELVRKKFPGVKVFNVYNNLVFGTPREARMYAHQRHAGTEFLHCPDLTSIRVSRNNGHIRVDGPGLRPLDVDMVVLATGIQPSLATRDLADKLHVDLDRDGFFAPDHSLLHATGTSLDGIYVAGCAAGPCDVATSATQAQAAAGDAVSKLMPGREIELEVLTCSIDEEKCAGCKLCISVCPYHAIAFDRVKKVSAINEVICRGCGTCAATCASGAAQARHYTDNELLAEIGGLIHA